MRNSQLPLVFTCLALSMWAQPVPRTECFPMEQLTPEQRVKSERMLLRAMDSEALYTVISGLKPMSGGYTGFLLKVDEPALEKVEEMRKLMAPWRCGGEVVFALHHHARAYAGKKDGSQVMRNLQGVVFHRASFGATVAAHPELFGVYGLTASADPMEVFMAVEYNETADRYRGMGILFGYPLEAVEFFAKNTFIPQDRSTDPRKPPTDKKAENGDASPKKPVITPRKFLSIPTVARETGAFVYAVPAGHVEDEADRRLKEKAAPILAEYKKRRDEYVGEGKPGIAALLRDWFCKSDTDCRPSNAVVPPLPAAEQK